jgi:hypothetical protein
VGLRAGLDAVVKRKIPSPRRKLNSGTPIIRTSLHYAQMVHHEVVYWCMCNIRGPFAKFVDSLCYTESELCGGAVTDSFLKHLPWQATHLLHRSTRFSRM